MTEVTKNNINDLYDEIVDNINKAAFVSIDCEFSALCLENSLFDTPALRYNKIKQYVKSTIPLQVGITAFHFDKHEYRYVGYPYRFYNFPFSITENKMFLCQSSALYFLSLSNFDFNKFVYSGLPYVNEEENAKLMAAVKDGTFLELCRNCLTMDEYRSCMNYVGALTEWYRSKETTDLEVCDVSNRSCAFAYVVHVELRKRIPKKVWTYTEGNKLKARKVTEQQYTTELHDDLKQETLHKLQGFSRVYAALSASRRPLIGHNLFLDLALLINTFDRPLPASYAAFKALVHSRFPSVFDTKHMSFQLKRLLPEQGRFADNGLAELYAYFSGRCGRHIAHNSPEISMDRVYECMVREQLHDAVYDCFCTGYCFVRMAHFLALQNYPGVRTRDVMSREHLNAAAAYRNNVNLIRASTPYLRLDGADPPSQRPPRLLVRHTANLDAGQVSNMLNEHGSTEVRACGRGMLIAAVANHASAARILQHFQGHEQLRVCKYSALRHSTTTKLAVCTGLLASVFAYFVYTNNNK